MQERGLKEWIAMWGSLVIANSYAQLPVNSIDHKFGSVVWLLLSFVWFFSHLAKVNKK